MFLDLLDAGHEKYSLIKLEREDVESFVRTSSCPTCNSARSPQKIATIGGSSWQTGLEVSECVDCKVLFYRNPPSESRILDYYSNHWNSTRGEIGDVSTLGLSVNRKIADLLSQLGLTGKNQTILDVGCGYGGMMAGLSSVGYKQVYGLEQSGHRRLVATDRFPNRIFKGGYQDCRPNIHFDVIYSNHVLEHIHRPFEAFRWMVEHVREDGIIIIVVPNNAWEPVVDQLMFVPHLHSFGKSSIARMADSLGYQTMFWHGSPKPHEICAVCFKTGHLDINELTARNFAEDKKEDTNSFCNENSRFYNFFYPDKQLDDGGHRLINWPTNSHRVKSLVQSEASFIDLDPKYKTLIRALLWRRRLGLKYKIFLRGERVINRTLATHNREVPDYNYLICSTTTGESNDLRLGIRDDFAPVFIK